MLAIIYSCYYKHVLQYQFIYSVISSFQLSHQAIYQLIHYLLNELKQKWLLSFTLKNPNSKLYSTGRRNHMFCSHLWVSCKSKGCIVFTFTFTMLGQSDLNISLTPSSFLPPHPRILLVSKWRVFLEMFLFNCFVQNCTCLSLLWGQKCANGLLKETKWKKIDKKKNKRENNKNTMPKTNHQGDGRLYC